MTDNLFHVIDDAQVVLRSKGVFKQVKLYRRGEHVYAGWGSGFIRLLKHGQTTHPSVSYDADSICDPGEGIALHNGLPTCQP